jgi:N-acyl-D-amino-acid deacylase
MYARPPGLAGHEEDGKPKVSYYSLGWFNRTPEGGGQVHWHTGSLPGTAALLIHRDDQVNMAVLFNGRVTPFVPHAGSAIEPLLNEVASGIQEWP